VIERGPGKEGGRRTRAGAVMRSLGTEVVGRRRKKSPGAEEIIGRGGDGVRDAQCCWVRESETGPQGCGRAHR
jgi:hypothetical protein